MSQTETMTDVKNSTVMQQFISCFMTLQSEFPEKMLRTMIQDKENSAVFFFSVLKNMGAHGATMSTSFVGYIYALYALAAIKEEAAYPVLLDILLLPEEEMHNLVGDILFDLPSILASVYNNNPVPIYQLIENVHANPVARDIGIEALAILFLVNKIDRQELVRAFHMLVQKLGEAQERDLLTSLTTCIIKTRLDELYESVRFLFQQNLIDTTFFTLEDFEELITDPHNYFKADLLIDDAIPYLREYYEQVARDEDGIYEPISFTDEQYKFWQTTLDEIAYDNGEVPEKAFKELLKHPNEAADLMLHVLSWAIDAYPNISEDCMAPIYALYLLAQLREKRAFPLIIDFLSLLEDFDEENRLLDVIAQDGAAILASVYNGEKERIFDLNEDSVACDLSRIIGIRSLFTLYNLHKIDRADLLYHFIELIQQLEREKKADILGILAIATANNCFYELYDCLKQSFQCGAISPDIISLKEYEKIIRCSLPRVEETRLIGDILEEAKSWSWVKQKAQAQAKAGRNDPCPCGSQKKYKKCCLRK